MKNEIRKLKPEEFPPLLNEIADPPKALYLEGVLPDSNELTYLTVVGSRRATTYGRDVMEKLISGLSGYPLAIVSGLAIGTDTQAHRQALAAGLPTIAVPGSGLDRSVLHPPSNRALADEIVENGGALLSEFAPTAPAGIHTFPKRNRIMAGLAKAILVIEAGEKSGTLITSRLALDYNREVLAVPGSIISAQSYGTNSLIRQGATAITSSNEILEALGFANEETGDRQLPLMTLDEQAIAELLSVEAIPRDEIIRQLGKSASEVSVTLAAMEIKGLIKETFGEVRLAY